jgi:DNA mismatch repair protein MutS2
VVRFSYNGTVDRHTLDKLEFEDLRQILAEHASCGLGRAMADKVKPVSRTDLIQQWHGQVHDLIEAAAELDLPPFGGVHDIREAIRVAVPPHCLEPDDLAVIAETLDATHGIVAWADRVRPGAGHLRAITEKIGDFKTLADAIRQVIGAKGEVRDDASSRLRRIRTEISQARISVGHVFDRLLRDRNLTRLLRYPQATFHDDRLVLPLAAEHRGRIPGIVHRSSDSGATLFVEPAAAVELNNQIIALKRDANVEIGRLLSHLTHQLYLNRDEIISTMDTLAILDLVTAKVRFARAYGLVCPAISSDRKLILRQARHPLLVRLAKTAATRGEQREVVPIDVRLGDDFDLLVITGPNTGGKTVALKTVGLACLMAQAGLPIAAAAGSTVPVYSEVLIDIGDEQSLQQSLSTFSAHLSRMLLILKQAGPGTLVLIDELGAGTDPDEGAAIGQAIVEELLHRRCAAMVTTHLGVLKSVAYREARAENGCVDFDVKTLQPTYRLLIGEPGNSNAINIAARLGLPSQVIAAARNHLGESHQQLNRAIRGTLQSRRQAEQARAEAESARIQALQEIEAARKQRESLADKQAEFDRWVEKIASLRPGDKVHVRRFDKPGTIVRVLLHKQLAVVAVGAMEMEIPLREIVPAPAA